MRNARAQRGFTMVELLVTMTVTAIGLAGLVTLYVTVSKANNTVSKSAEAIGIGEQTMESLRDRPLSAIEIELGAAPAQIDLAEASGRNEQAFRRNLNMTVLDDDLVMIRIEVAWTENGAEPGSENGKFDHQIAMELIRNRREAL